MVVLPLGVGKKNFHDLTGWIKEDYLLAERDERGRFF
jgi:hypothetical protein